MVVQLGRKNQTSDRRLLTALQHVQSLTPSVRYVIRAPLWTTILSLGPSLVTSLEVTTARVAKVIISLASYPTHLQLVVIFIIYRA